MPKYQEKVLLAITTAPKDFDINFFNNLIKNKIIACVNIIEKIKSIYIFEDKFCEDLEILAIMKLKSSNKENLKNYFENNHPYKIPELLFFDSFDLNKSYLDFVLNS